MPVWGFCSLDDVDGVSHNATSFGVFMTPSCCCQSQTSMKECRWLQRNTQPCGPPLSGPVPRAAPLRASLLGAREQQDPSAGLDCQLDSSVLYILYGIDLKLTCVLWGNIPAAETCVFSGYLFLRHVLLLYLHFRSSDFYCSSYSKVHGPCMGACACSYVQKHTHTHACTHVRRQTQTDSQTDGNVFFKFKIGTFITG